MTDIRLCGVINPQTHQRLGFDLQMLRGGLRDVVHGCQSESVLRLHRLRCDALRVGHQHLRHSCSGEGHKGC